MLIDDKGVESIAFHAAIVVIFLHRIPADERCLYFRRVCDRVSVVFQGSRTDGTACAGCADKTQPVMVDGDGEWYCEACVEEFHEELEQERQQQEQQERQRQQQEKQGEHKKQKKARRGKRAVDWQETRREANGRVDAAISGQ